MIVSKYKTITKCLFCLILNISFLIKSFPVSAGQNTEIDSMELILPDLTDSARILTLIRLASHHKFSNADTAMYYARLAERESESIDFKKGQTLSLSILGLIEYGKGDFPEALKYMKHLIPIQTSMGDSIGLSKTLNNIGSVNAKIGNWEEAANYFMESLRIKEGIKAPKMTIAMAYNNLGNIYSDINNYQESEVFYKKAIEINLEIADTSGLGLVYGNLARLYRKTDNYPKAKQLLFQSIRFERIAGNLKDVSGNLTSLGTLYADQKNMDSAIYYYDRAIETGLVAGSSYEVLFGQKSKAEILLRTGAVNEAHQLGLEALKGLEMVQSKEMKKEVLYLLSQTAERLHKPQQSLEYFKQYSSLKDSLLNESNARNINELKWKYEDEKSDLLITQLKNKNSMEQKRKMLAYILFGISLVLIGVLIHSLYLRNKLLAEKEKTLHSQKEMQKMELDLKAQELYALSTNLLEKNSTLGKVKESILQSDSQNNRGTIKLIDQSMSLEKDWSQFKIHFEKVHHGFFDRLQQRFPDLTPNEHRLCAYLKLNLSSKEISQLSNVSVGAVERSRIRMRKKLDINPGENLTSFIQSIA